MINYSRFWHEGLQDLLIKHGWPAYVVDRCFRDLGVKYPQLNSQTKLYRTDKYSINLIRSIDLDLYKPKLVTHAQQETTREYIKRIFKVYLHNLKPWNWWNNVYKIYWNKQTYYFERYDTPKIPLDAYSELIELERMGIAVELPFLSSRDITERSVYYIEVGYYPRTDTLYIGYLSKDV
jgi:hypothetical protein